MLRRGFFRLGFGPLGLGLSLANVASFLVYDKLLHLLLNVNNSQCGGGRVSKGSTTAVHPQWLPLLLLGPEGGVEPPIGHLLASVVAFPDYGARG